MNEDAQREADLALIKRHCEQLIEHFDSVQIFANRNDPDRDGTVHVSRGVGNWFARYGQVEAWLVTEHEELRVRARSNCEE